jgi:hypothetical protein
MKAAISMPRIAMVRIQELARLFCFCELVAKRWSRPVTPTSREARDLFPLAQTIFGDQCTLVQVTQNLLERFADSSAIAENSAMPPLANAGESKCLSPARSLLPWSSVVLKIETVPGAKCASVRLIGRFARVHSRVNSPNHDERTQCCVGDGRSDPGELGRGPVPQHKASSFVIAQPTNMNGSPENRKEHRDDRRLLPSSKELSLGDDSRTNNSWPSKPIALHQTAPLLFRQIFRLERNPYPEKPCGCSMNACCSECLRKEQCRHVAILRLAIVVAIAVVTGLLVGA